MSDELPPLPSGRGLEDVLGQSTEMFQRSGADKQKPPFEWSSKMLPDGQTVDTIELPRELTQQIMQDLKWKTDTMAAMQGEVNRIDKQRASGNPLLDVLATVGGELAAGDPRLPPVVSALGRTALRLNPSQQELTDRKLGLLQVMGQQTHQDVQSQISMARLNQTGDIANRKLEEQKRTLDVKQAEFGDKSARLTAQKGGGPMSKEEFRGLYPDSMTAEEVDRRYKSHLAQADIAVKGKEAEEALKEKGSEKSIAQKGEEARKTEAARARHAYELADHKAATGLEARKTFADYKEAITKDKALEVVPPKDKTTLIGLRETERYIDGIGKLLDDPQFGELMGAEKLGRYMTRRLTSDQRVKLENYLKHETPRILNLVLRGGTGGASLLRTEEGRKMVQSLGVMTDMTVSQAKQVLGNIQDVVSQNRKSVMEATPKAPWDDYPDLLGKDSSYRPTKVGEKNAGGEKASGETATRRKNPKDGKWWVLKGDKWQPE